MTSVEEYRLLGFADADREAAEEFAADQAVVKDLADQIRDAIGKLGSEPQFRMPEDPRNSVQAFLDTLPDIRRYHAERGIPDDISWATLADLGQQLKVNRRTHGTYGLETHWWMTIHWTGQIYALGRLQYLLHQVPADKPVPGTEPGEWIIGVHIPEIGPLTPEAVDDSLQQAREFFPRYFPEYPVKTANLWSWLIDPYLLDNLPQDSNMVKFGRRFTPYGTPNDSQDSAIFFTFRTHGLERLDELPQDTRLQQLVVRRIKEGGTWQSAYGYLRL
ncbi:acyltransferase domain-containing protein [Kribbella sp. HUAS MG21]|uniref:Acyltransferase domain-containing protein n=1 Tax=Kribbella sp. HUAS MG21 TaxID=3160966 RepID=A0AAU7TP67_9ACTN